MKALGLAISTGVLLIILAIVFSVGIDINDTVKTTNGDSSTVTFLNESVALAADGNQLACNGDRDSPSDISISFVNNVTGVFICGGPTGSEGDGTCDGTATGGNYTLTGYSGSINFTTSTADDGSGYPEVASNYTVTYTCASYGRVWAVSKNGTYAIGELANWQETVSLVVAAVIIITLLFTGFGAYLYFRRM